ncbi:MAG: hypothetical protein MdMp014T_1429 [Treponematales bacterium]
MPVLYLLHRFFESVESSIARLRRPGPPVCPLGRLQFRLRRRGLNGQSRQIRWGNPPGPGALRGDILTPRLCHAQDIRPSARQPSRILFLYRHHILHCGRPVAADNQDTVSIGETVSVRQPLLYENGRFFLHRAGRVDVYGKRVVVYAGRVVVYGRRVVVYGKRVVVYAGRVVVYARRVDVYGKRVDVYAERVDVYAKRVDVYAERVDVYAKRVDVYAERVDVYGKRVDVYARRVDIYAERVDVYGERVDVYAKRVDVYAKRVVVYAERVDVYAKRVVVYGRRVVVYGERGTGRLVTRRSAAVFRAGRGSRAGARRARLSARVTGGNPPGGAKGKKTREFKRFFLTRKNR